MNPVPYPLLRLNYTDGSHEIIASDTSWKVSSGPLLESDLLMGESYDARRELGEWDQPGYADADWWPTVKLPSPTGKLVATNGPSVRRQEELRPVSIRFSADLVNRRWIFDMGQNMVGWVRLRISGERGQTVTLRYAEALNLDGTLYTTNLRSARSTDYFTLKGEGAGTLHGGGTEVWEPRFTFHGFRYVELQGFTGTPDESSLTGIVIHSDMQTTGSFECSDPLINQLQHNIAWGQKGNFVDVPTDCPQRDERLGWTGDAQVFIRTAAFNRDVAGFFTKWTRDLEDAQYPDGSYPAVAPNPQAWTIGDGGPAWADAGVICPWTIYQCYGDRRLLQEHYPSMQRFIEFLSNTSRDGLRCYEGYSGWLGFGDWLALDGSRGHEGGTSKELIGTAFYAHSSHLLARIAGILGKADDAQKYTRLFEEARAAFQSNYLLPNGTLRGGTQTSTLLALEFELLPEDRRPAAANELARSIAERGDHLSTGFVGTPYINWILSRMGHLETAYALLKQTSWPSWLYPVTQGATTIWERWDGWTHDKGFQDPGMNSFNHYAYGAVGAWMYAVIGGIDLDPARPGYKHILMRPRPGGGLTHVSAGLRSLHGQIGSEWRLEDGRFGWRVCIPANSSARLSLPCSDPAHVNESGVPAAQAAGVSLVGVEDGCAVFEVGAGTYLFSCPLAGG